MKKYWSVGSSKIQVNHFMFSNIWTKILTTGYNSLPNNLGKTVIYFFKKNPFSWVKSDKISST